MPAKSGQDTISEIADTVGFRLSVQTSEIDESDW
jgi:hypothetical protein